MAGIEKSWKSYTFFSADYLKKEKKYMCMIRVVLLCSRIYFAVAEM